MSEAKAILRRNTDKYHKSTLFIYFQGRLERIEVSQLKLSSMKICPFFTTERSSQSFINISQRS